MSAKVDRFARRLEKVEKHGIATAIQPRLPYSTLDGGALTVTDQRSGEVRGYFGEQWDGTTTAASVGGTPPPPPTMPLVTPKQGGLSIYWDGTFVDESPTRMDWKRVTFHAIRTGDEFAEIDPLNPAQMVGEITIATGGEVFAVLTPDEHLIYAVTWTEAGKFSIESDPAFGTPLTLLDDEDFQAISDEVAAATLAVADAPAVYREGEQPVVPAGKRAIWFDTANDNLAWYFDGTDWTDMPLGSGALAANAVIADTIAVGALDGKTITGPLIQTVTANARGIKLVGNSMVAYNAIGDTVFALNGATGALALAGALLTGGSITGPLVQTTGLANRGIKLSGSNLIAYDGSGSDNVVINGAAGTLTVKGASSSITGALIRTAATGERMELSTVGDSQIQFFSDASPTTPIAYIGTFVDNPLAVDLTGTFMSTTAIGNGIGPGHAQFLVGRNGAGQSFVNTISDFAAFTSTKSNGIMTISYSGANAEIVLSAKTITLTGGVNIIPRGAMIYRSGAQSIPTNADTVVTMNAVGHDNLSSSPFYSAGTPGRLTVPTGHGGTYLITAALRYSANVTGGRGVAIRKNGGQYLSNVVVANAGAGLPTSPTVSTIVRLSDGDYVQVMAFQNSGANIDLDASGNQYSSLALARLGSAN